MKICSNCFCGDKQGMAVINARMGTTYIWCKRAETQKPEKHACKHWKDKCEQCKGLMSCKGE